MERARRRAATTLPYYILETYRKLLFDFSRTDI